MKHTKVKIAGKELIFVKEKVKGPGLLCLLGLHRMKPNEERMNYQIFRLGNTKSIEIHFQCTRSNCYHSTAEFFELIGDE